MFTKLLLLAVCASAVAPPTISLDLSAATTAGMLDKPIYRTDDLRPEAKSRQKPKLLDTGVFSAMKPQAAGHRHLLTKATAANWTDLKTLCEAGGNEVTLTDDFDPNSYTEQIDFSGKTCVVIGNGKTVDAKGAGRFFYGYGAGSSLEVHGLVLKNGKVSMWGGAVYANSADVKIYDTEFISNDASAGGAIFAAGGANVEIYTCTFESNTANQGGAIYADTGAKVEIYTSTFESNTATYQCAGGISAGQPCSSDSDCPGSYCTGGGNDIYRDPYGTVVFKGCTSSGELAEIQMTDTEVLPDITSLLPCPTDSPIKALTYAPTYAPDESSSESDGISTGAIVGIAIGILVFVAIIAMFACKPSKKSNAGTPEAGSVAQTKVVVAQQPESNV